MKVAVLTAGGVAPGMNAAVRAVAQTAFSRGWEVVGVENGYGGLLEGRLGPVDRVQLGGLMRRGGTLLGTDRSKEVETDEGRERAVRRLEEAGTMVGARGEKTERIPLSAVVGEERPLDPAAYRLAQILAEMPG